MDPNELAERIFSRALEADEVEWKVLYDLFKALPYYDRCICWCAMARADAKDRVKVMHRHVAWLVVECFNPKVNTECEEMRKRLDEHFKKSYVT